MRSRASQWLLVVLLSIVCMTSYTLWLVMMRCVMDGESYRWSASLVLSRIGGTGTSDDFWVNVLMTAFVVGMIYLGSRGAKVPFAAMFFGWFGAHFYAALSLAIQHGSDWRFRGDTLGIDVPLNVVMPTLYILLLALAVVWLVVSRGHPQPQPRQLWSRWHLGLLVAATAMLPAQFMLLSSGPPHGATDQIGVLLTVTQWILLCLAMTLPVELMPRKLHAHHESLP